MLLNAVPEKDEVEKFLHHPFPDLSLIAPPDLFFKDVCTIPEVKTRVEAIQVCQEWSNHYSSAVKRFLKFKKGFIMQRDDENIRVLLRYALGAGNYLNGQSVRGGAYAFKLDIMS